MFEWSTFLQLADELVARDGTDSVAEACWRSAISRAYYGAFHHALAYAKIYENYQPPRKDEGSAHWHLIDFIGKIPAYRQHKQIHDLMKSLRDARVLADYSHQPPISNASAHLHITNAKKLVKLIDDLRTRRGSPS